MSSIIIYQDILSSPSVDEKQTENSLREQGSNLMSEFFILNPTLHIHFLCLQRDVLLLSQILYVCLV